MDIKKKCVDVLDEFVSRYSIISKYQIIKFDLLY